MSESGMAGETPSQWQGDSKDASNASKEILSLLISEHQITYEAVDQILSGVKNKTFRTEDVKFRVEDLLSGHLFDPNSPVKRAMDPKFDFIVESTYRPVRRGRERHELVGALLKTIRSVVFEVPYITLLRTLFQSTAITSIHLQMQQRPLSSTSIVW